MPSHPPRLHVLGPVTVRGATDPPSSSRVTQPRQLAILCYLALARPRGLHARDTLLALLWPDYDDARGRRALRNALHGLRLALGSSAIVSAGNDLIGLDPEHLTCDAFDLERGTLGASDAPGDAAMEPLQGLHVTGAASFDQWMSTERDRLRALAARRGSEPPPAPSPAPAPATRPHAQGAWALCARGHYLFLRSAHGGRADDLLLSRDYFERALALEPGFAPALAGLSNFYAVAARRGVLAPFQDTFGKAIALSEQIVAMGAGLAIPHVHLGVKALYLDDDFERAGAEFSAAVSVEPGYAEAHRFKGVWLSVQGCPEEAVRAMELAVELEPDIPTMTNSLAAALLAVGRAAEAEAALRRTLSLDAAHAPARERLVRLLEDQGRFEEALAERLRAPALRGAESFRADAASGADGYQRALREALGAEAEVIEARIGEGGPPTVNELFSPPVLRLVAILERLGEARRARAWRLQATAARPALARWFDLSSGSQRRSGAGTVATGRGAGAADARSP